CSRRSRPWAIGPQAYLFKTNSSTRKTTMVQMVRSRAPGNRGFLDSAGRGFLSVSWPWSPSSLAAMSSPGAEARDRAGQATTRAQQRAPTIKHRRIPDSLVSGRPARRSELHLQGDQDAHPQSEEGGTFEECGDDDHRRLNPPGRLGLASHAFQGG